MAKFYHQPFLQFILISVLSFTSVPGYSYEQGDFLVRVRAINVNPDDSSGGVRPALLTTRVGVDDDTVPEIDFTYMFHKNWGLELILATSEHNVSGTAGALNNVSIANAYVLPPTLTLQYHFLPDSTIRPYAGVGINYSLFYSEDATSAFEAIAGKTDVQIDPSVGFAGQVGVDIAINKGWFVNLDVKYIDMSTEITLRTAGLGTQKVNVDIDPFIFGIGVGRRF